MPYMVTFTINIPQMLAYIYIYHTWILWVIKNPHCFKVWDRNSSVESYRAAGERRQPQREVALRAGAGSRAGMETRPKCSRCSPRRGVLGGVSIKLLNKHTIPNIYRIYIYIQCSWKLQCYNNFDPKIGLRSLVQHSSLFPVEFQKWPHWLTKPSDG